MLQLNRFLTERRRVIQHSQWYCQLSDFLIGVVPFKTKIILLVNTRGLIDSAQLKQKIEITVVTMRAITDQKNYVVVTFFIQSRDRHTNSINIFGTFQTTNLMMINGLRQWKMWNCINSLRPSDANMTSVEIGRFPSQRASYVERVSIPWCYHALANVLKPDVNQCSPTRDVLTGRAKRSHRQCMDCWLSGNGQMFPKYFVAIHHSYDR